MPPRRAQATQGTQQDEVAGPSNRHPDYVYMTLAQMMIAEGFMPESLFRAQLQRLAKVNDVTDSMLRNALAELNNSVGFLDIGIERIRLPADDSWYVCLVDKERDEASKQMGSKYPPEQVLFARAVVEAIAGASPPQGRLLADVSQIQLINLDVRRAAAPAAEAGSTQAAAKGRKLSQVEKGGALRSLAADGWLHEARTGYYTLGPRTLTELQDLVLSVLPDETAAKLKAEYM